MAGQTVPVKAGTSSLLVSVCLLGLSAMLGGTWVPTTTILAAGFPVHSESAEGRECGDPAVSRWWEDSA